MAFYKLHRAEVEAARTKAITEEEVREHIDRMGTTPFYLSSLEIDLDEGVGMGFSMLHKLRARAAEELQETILAHYHARKLERTPSRALFARVGARLRLWLRILHAPAPQSAPVPT